MLMTQAKALDFFFYQMLGKLADTHNVKQIQAYTDIALRSQNQSRKVSFSEVDCTSVIMPRLLVKTTYENDMLIAGSDIQKQLQP